MRGPEGQSTRGLDLAMEPTLAYTTEDDDEEVSMAVTCISLYLMRGIIQNTWSLLVVTLQVSRI